MEGDAERPYRMTVAEREALRALGDKYARLLELRGALGRGAPSPEARVRLRAIAEDYPGSLRELETLATDELERRAALVRDAGDEVPAWLMWSHAYHEEMRGRLRARRGGARTRAPHGRLNAEVFAALGARFGVAASIVWDALFPRRGAAPRPYR